MFAIVNMAISFDSKVCITVTKKNDRLYFIKMYGMESKELVFEEEVGGQPDCYIKIKEVV